MANIKMFCLHHTEAPHRKTKLIEDFSIYSLDIEWVEKFHPSQLDLTKFKITHDLLKISEISLYLKHKYCLEQQKINNYENILVFEDDVIIPKYGFLDYLNTINKEFKEVDGDIIFIGECCNIKPIDISELKTVYYHPSYESRCAHCYMVNIKCIDKILESIDNISDAFDWKLNYIIKEKKLRCCYAHPGLLQATEAGIEKSLIRN